MINITAIGRLTKDPVLETTPSGKPVCHFRIACDRPGTLEGTDYIDVVTWRGAEENATHLTQGRQVAITGRLEYSEWEKEGQKRSRHRIVADDVKWLAKPVANNGQVTEKVPAEAF